MVLLVDDNAEQLELRQLILERQGFAVATAGTAGEAIAHCGHCDTVVMDLRMPALRDGLGLIRDFHARAPQTPIVVLAGFPDDLNGRPEIEMVHRILRKGTATGVLIELLRGAGEPSNP